MKGLLAKYVCKSGTKCIYVDNEFISPKEADGLAKGDELPKTVKEWCPHCEGDTLHYFEEGRGFVCVACNKTGTEGGGCFITTAVCLSRDLPDDCYELNILRAFRDNHLKYNRDFAYLINIYYEIAPKIVREIDKSPNRNAIYNELYDNYIIKSIKSIENNDYKSATDIYVLMALKLFEKYKPFT